MIARLFGPDEVQPYVHWTLGKHRMMCGDSTDPEAIDLLMNGTKANLVVTDPPYNVGHHSHGFIIERPVFHSLC